MAKKSNKISIQCIRETRGSVAKFTIPRSVWYRFQFLPGSPIAQDQDRFKRSDFPKCVVLQAIYWYLRYALSYRDIEELMTERGLNTEIEIRQVKYLNNTVEQDYRSIKRIVRPMLGFKEFHSASVTLSCIELVRMIRKSQLKNQNDLRQTTVEIFYSLAA